MKAALYIVATPIGNLQDITLRAVEVLGRVNWVAAEDTRHSRRLLQHYNIPTKVFSLHEHNESQRAAEVVSLLEKNESIALISDAGTPLISDPGYRLVKHVQAAGFAVVPIPGPSSLIAALSASGLPTDRFVFEGFLPAKGEKRSKCVAQLSEEVRTVVLFESVHRITDLLELLVKYFGEQREACLARELTKTYETIKRAPLQQLLDWVLQDKNQQKGEFVVMIAGKPEESELNISETDTLLVALLKELPLSRAVKVAQTITGGSRQKLYQRALVLQQKND